MKQYEAVIETMEKAGGIATLGFLYREVFKIKACSWNTRTPFASIRRIVQQNKHIYKIKPGLYALEKYRERFNRQGIVPQTEAPASDSFDHAYYQGLLLEIGNMNQWETYVPAQDKNKPFLGKTLGEVAQLTEIHPFTYPSLLERARSIDVLWFNVRGMLSAAFEVEHTTDMQNSLLKFFDLQDFYADFYIVASDKRQPEFCRKLNYSAFSEIRDRVKFLDYSYISKWHTKLSELMALAGV